jgi:hypothetical protein
MVKNMVNLLQKSSDSPSLHASATLATAPGSSQGASDLRFHRPRIISSERRKFCEFREYILTFALFAPFA